MKIKFDLDAQQTWGGWLFKSNLSSPSKYDQIHIYDSYDFGNTQSIALFNKLRLVY